MTDKSNPQVNTDIPFPIINILIILTILLILIVPSMLKLNKGCFIVGFIIAVLIMNLSLTFFKVLYYDNSWYTQQYQYNNSYVYKEALNDVVNDTKNGFYYYMSEAYHAVGNSFKYHNIKDNTIYVFSTIYNYTLKPIGKGIKHIFYGEPKSNYKTTRQKHL